MALYEPAPSRKAVSGQLLWFLGWLAVTVIGAILKPNPHGHGTHEQLGLPPCPSVLLFDRPCPGCGLTTSFTATIHGQWAAAFHAHPLGPFVYLMFTASALLALRGYFRQQRLNTATKQFSMALGAFAIFFIGFGLFRWVTTPNYASPGEVTAYLLRDVPVRR